VEDKLITAALINGKNNAVTAQTNNPLFKIPLRNKFFEDKIILFPGFFYGVLFITTLKYWFLSHILAAPLIIIQLYTREKLNKRCILAVGPTVFLNAGGPYYSRF
jgi:hypothetical protein